MRQFAHPRTPRHCHVEGERLVWDRCKCCGHSEGWHQDEPHTSYLRGHRTCTVAGCNCRRAIGSRSR